MGYIELLQKHRAMVYHQFALQVSIRWPEAVLMGQILIAGVDAAALLTPEELTECESRLWEAPTNGGAK